jgi:hypothetical protein
MAETGQSLTEAAENVVQQLAQSIDLFDEATHNLRLKAAEYGPDVLPSDVESFIGVFETTLTGCFNWSLVTGRYGVPKDMQVDGSLVVNF